MIGKMIFEKVSISVKWRRLLTWRDHGFICKVYSVLFYVQDFLSLFNNTTCAAVRHHETRLVEPDHFHGRARFFVWGMQMCAAFLHRRNVLCRPFGSLGVLDLLILAGNLIAVYYRDRNYATRILQPLLLPKGEKPGLLRRFAGSLSRCGRSYHSLGRWICRRRDHR